MRTTLLLRSILAALAITVAVPACSKSPDITVENIQEKGAITEQHDAGAVVWSVTSDGQVRALVKKPDGKAFENGVTGTLTVKGSDPAATPTTAALAQDAKTGLLSATIPKLDDDITELKYELKVDGKAVRGALHLPPGGTKELEESAKEAADVKIEDGKKGPNGGVIQVVGDDVVEVVADKASGEVRVYVLDEDLQPVKIEDRKVTIGFVTAKGPETIVLAPDPGGLYFNGKMSVRVNPVKITVAVTSGGRTHAALYGYHPGTIIVCGPSAPVIVVFVNVKWDVDVDVNSPPIVVIDDHHRHWKGKGKHKRKHKGRGHSVTVKVH